MSQQTGDDVAADLHTLLVNADAAPPYVLVGHSLGGLYVRSFTAKYPHEVAGLVLVDSSHEQMFERVREELGDATVREGARDERRDARALRARVARRRADTGGACRPHGSFSAGRRTRSSTSGSRSYLRSSLRRAQLAELPRDATDDALARRCRTPGRVAAGRRDGCRTPGGRHVLARTDPSRLVASSRTTWPRCRRARATSSLLVVATSSTTTTPRRCSTAIRWVLRGVCPSPLARGSVWGTVLRSRTAPVVRARAFPPL